MSKTTVSSSKLREAIFEVSKLTPEEINLFFKYSNTKEEYKYKSGGSLVYDVYQAILSLSPEKFFRKLADFIEFKDKMNK